MVTAVDEEIAALARRQHGVYSRSQVMAIGATPGLVKRRLTSGAWSRAGFDVYGLPGVPESFEREVMIACLTVPRAVASHETAASLHGFPYLQPGPVTVTTDLSSTHRTTAARVFRSAVAIPEDQLDRVDGIPATNPARTVVDLAGMLHGFRFERIVDDLLCSGVVEFDLLQATFEACARRGRRGIALLRELLEERGPGDTVTQSVLEAEVLRLIRDAGLPEPVCQYPLPWRDAAQGRVDFAYPEQRLIVEADGRRWHARYQDFERDRRRDAEAMRVGWRVLRFTWRQTRGDPGFVVSTLRAVLAEAGPNRGLWGPESGPRNPGFDAIAPAFPYMTGNLRPWTTGIYTDLHRSPPHRGPGSPHGVAISAQRQERANDEQEPTHV